MTEQRTRARRRTEPAAIAAHELRIELADGSGVMVFGRR